MEIKIDAEKFHERLTCPSLSPQDQFYMEVINQLKDGEDWKKRAIQPQSVRHQFEGEKINLPFPFESAWAQFKRKGESYSGNVIIRGIFSEIGGMREQINEQISSIYGKNWMPTGQTRGGYILYNREPIIAISKDFPSYNISVGDKGMVERRLGSLEEFVSEMLSLGKVTNTFVNVAVSLAVEQGKLPSNPDLSLTLTC